MEQLVSVVMPCYNGEKYISQAIESVLNQSYSNIELLVIDDCSTDSSAEIIKQYQNKDKRIKYFKTQQPSGSPTLPRNIGLQKSNGQYIAFLDCDDYWNSTKIQNQIALFNDKSVVLVFSNYEKIDELGNKNNRLIIAPAKVDYFELLKGDCIGTLTAIYDKTKAKDLRFSNVGAEDYIFFIELLKKGGIALNTNSIEAFYRQTKISLSGNKLKSARWNWNIYRNLLKLGLGKSIYYFIIYAFRGLFKYLK